MILLLVRNRAGLGGARRAASRAHAAQRAASSWSWSSRWLVWRAGWRAAARFGVMTNRPGHALVRAELDPRRRTDDRHVQRLQLVSTYSEEALASKGFADAVFDSRFTRIDLTHRNEVELDNALPRATRSTT